MSIHTNINVIFGTDESLSERFINILSPENYSISVCSDNEISAAAAKKSYSGKLVILCLTGFDVIERIRFESTVPILYITEKADEYSVIMALEKGADAVVQADIPNFEFAARVKTMLRRSSVVRHVTEYSGGSNMCSGELSIDVAAREIRIGDKPVKATKIEFGILEYLMRNRGRICSVDDIYASVWRNKSYDVRKTVVEHIRRLRGKIENDPKKPEYIKVVFGAGYIFTDSITASAGGRFEAAEAV